MENTEKLETLPQEEKIDSQSPATKDLIERLNAFREENLKQQRAHLIDKYYTAPLAEMHLAGVTDTASEVPRLLNEMLIAYRGYEPTAPMVARGKGYVFGTAYDDAEERLKQFGDLSQLCRLTMSLDKKWFDMIVSGEKREEYRAIKKHWISRLVKPELRKHEPDALIQMASSGVDIFNNKIDYVEARNGYSSESPCVRWNHKGLSIGLPKKEWCEPEDRNKLVFILSIGDLITKNNG